MKYIKSILFLFPVYWITGFYDIEFNTAEGVPKKMSDWQGKKIMVVLLPVTENADNSIFLTQLDSLSRNTMNPVTVIGVPSIEDGYNSTNSISLLQWYRQILGPQVIITEPMNTRKTSTAQHALFHWLTHTEGNGHFNEDIINVRQRFFIDAQGELYGMVNPRISLTANGMKLLLQ